MDFRIRENDGQGFFLTICPWQMPIFGLPSLTLPALIKSFVSVFVRGQCISMLTVANASGSDFRSYSVFIRGQCISMLTVANASGSDFPSYSV
jgi:hypothetical protein